MVWPTPDSPEVPKPRGKLARAAATVWPLVAGALFGIAMRLIFRGKPGNPYEPMGAVFIFLVPAGVGALSAFLTEGRERKRAGYFFGRGALANVLFVAGTMAILVEGLICAVIIVPLFAIIGGLAAVITAFVCRRVSRPEWPIYSFAALPLLLGGLGPHLPLPHSTTTIERSRLVNAPTLAVWRDLLTAHDIQPVEIDSAWMYRIGVPVPLSALTETRDGMLIRHIAMGKGIHFDQVSTDWVRDRRIRWLYRFDKDSFPAGALDDHVRIGGDYFDVLDTEYRLDEVGESSRLTVSMTYRVSTEFNWYAKPIAAFLVANFEEAALRFYAGRAEAESVGFR